MRERRNSTRTATRTLVGAAITALLWLNGTHVAFAASDAVRLQQSASAPTAVSASADPDVRWRRYLEANGFVDGYNEKGGRNFFIAQASARVLPGFGNGWIAARNAAYDSAVLQAKAQLAEFVGTTIEAKRGLGMVEDDGNAVPELRDAIAADRELSLMEKGERLAHAEFDRRMRRHDPAWDGTGMSEAQRHRKVVSERIANRQMLVQSARQLIQGASPIFYAEGPDDRNDYVVQVGFVWSAELAGLARSFADPDVEVPTRAPGRSIADTLTAMTEENPTSLAAFVGLRVWRDERGRRVLVSSAASGREGSDSISRRRNAAVARRQIAGFIAETVESRDTMNGGAVDDLHETGSRASYSDKAYESRIDARIEQTRLTGVTRIREWKGTHPVSGDAMLVSIYAWTPDSTAQATDFARTTDAAGSTRSASPRRGLVGPSATFDDF